MGDNQKVNYGEGSIQSSEVFSVQGSDGVINVNMRVSDVLSDTRAVLTDGDDLYMVKHAARQKMPTAFFA